MPIEYRIDPDARLEAATFRGRVDDAQVLDYLERLVRDPTHDPEMDTLVDLRAVEGVGVTGAGVRALSDLAARLGSRLRRTRTDRTPRVAVVADQAAAFGVSRMYEAFREGADAPYEVRVFRDMDEARRWIGTA